MDMIYILAFEYYGVCVLQMRGKYCCHQFTFLIYLICKRKVDVVAPKKTSKKMLEQDKEIMSAKGDIIIKLLFGNELKWYPSS